MVCHEFVMLDQVQYWGKQSLACFATFRTFAGYLCS